MIMDDETTPVRRRRDAGATPVTVVIGIGILVALFAGVITTMGAVASNESSGAQHAADAAALGGARGVLDDLPTDLLLGFTTPADIPLMVGGGTCLGNGRGEAARLAAANGADLTSYCYNVWADEVSVSVKLRSTAVAGDKVTAKAEAETTFTADECRLDPGFDLPTEEPEPPGDDVDVEEDDAPPPPPPGPMTTWIDCGIGRQVIEFRPVVSRFFFRQLADDVEDVDPRLTK
jgi:hypothetical protein